MSCNLRHRQSATPLELQSVTPPPVHQIVTPCESPLGPLFAINFGESSSVGALIRSRPTRVSLWRRSSDKMGNNGSGKVDMTTEPPPVMSASTFNPTLSQASTSLPTPSSTIGDVEMVVTADAELIATVPVPSTSAIDPPAAKVQDEGESESESSDEEYDSEEDYEPAGWDGIRRRETKE